MKRKEQKKGPIMVIGVHSAAFEYIKREQRLRSKKLGVSLTLSETVDQLISQLKAGKN